MGLNIWIFTFNEYIVVYTLQSIFKSAVNMNILFMDEIHY